MLPDTVTSALNRALSRSALDVPPFYSAPGVHLAKVDIGAFGESACFQDASGAVTMVTGEPLLQPGDGSAWRSRAVDTRLLHDALRRGDHDALTRTRGQFTLVHYTPPGHQLLLATTDQLGVRPLYYTAAGDWIVFASATRILESATHEGVMAELARPDPPDPGRLMEFYLLLNPTRSQLHGYLEDLDQYRLEHQPPFLDTAVVATALAIPLDWLQRHDLYHKWLNCFSDPGTPVTWQTYPGHQPCPPPSGFLDRRYLTLVAVAQLAGSGRHGYAIAMARDLARWWERAGRRPVPIPADVDAPA
jgi:hypothetical protein